MEMGLLIFNKLLTMFIYVLLGFVIVRCGLLSEQDSRSLATLSLYVVCPIAIMNGFEVDCTPDLMSGLLLAFCFGLLTHAVFIFGMELIGKIFHMSAVEKNSVSYSNAGILTIPIVTAMLGSEWVIFTCTFTAIQIVLQWSHCRPTISGDKHIDVKKILLNSNLIAMYIGIIILFTGFRFPGPIDSAIDAIAGMIGPVGMIVSGMVIGGMPLKDLVKYPRAWLVVVLRLIVFPVIMCLIAKYSGITSLVPDGVTILMIVMLSVSAPSGATVLQMTKLFSTKEQAEYAGVINVLTMLFCAVTMPLVISLYYM